MASKKLRTCSVHRTFLVEREVTVRAETAAQALEKASQFSYDDFDDNADITYTGEESVFVDYTSTVARKL